LYTDAEHVGECLWSFSWNLSHVSGVALS
jgi:hypothetical protein